MQRKQLLSFLLIFIFLLDVLHFIALQFYLYWAVWWFDVLMHFLGGFWVGLAALWLIFLSGYTKYNVSDFSAKSIFLTTLSSVIIIGALWEFFELAVGVPVVGNYASDTFTDLVIGMLGATCASVFFNKKYAK
jgi:hypothetical protein